MSGIRYFSEVLNQKGAPALYEDLIDNIPAATFEGRLFFATDVTSGETIFRDNGDGTWSALAGNAGVGPFINGVTDLIGGVGLGGSLDQNTEILLDAQIFKFTYDGDCLLLDPVNDLYYFGKGNALDVGCGIHITEDTIYTQYLTNENGLKLDFANILYKFGDFGIVNNGTSIVIDDNNIVINTSKGGTTIGLQLDFANAIYKLGDSDNVVNGTYLQVYDNNGEIKTFYQNSPNGLSFDFANNIYSFGDFGGTYNATYIEINDNNQRITFGTQEGLYNFVFIKAFANNAAAIAGGLSVGDIYRSSTGGGDQLHIVH